MLLAAWVWQDAIPSYICVNPCYLWETLLCKKFLCVPWVLWEYSLPRISRICTDGLVALIRPQNSQKFGGAVGCVGTAGCHTLLHLCKSVLSVGATSQPEGSVCSVRSVGDIVSHGFHRSTQMVCCVNSPTEFTEFTEVLGCCWQRGYGRMPYPPNLCASVGATSQPEGSVCSVRSVGGFSRPEECQSVGTSTLPEGSVGDYSFSMRKRLTMPKTRA